MRHHGRVTSISTACLATLAVLLLAEAAPGTVTWDPGRQVYVVEYVDEAGQPQTYLWEPAYKILPTIQATVTFDQAANEYQYSYVIANGTGAPQCISWIILDVDHAALHIHDVGAPEKWMGTLLKWYPGVSWEGVDGICPGQSRQGFSYRSPFPPGPRQMILAGFISVADIPFDYIEEEDWLLLQSLSKFPVETHYKKVLTQGPVLPPSPPPPP